MPPLRLVHARAVHPCPRRPSLPVTSTRASYHRVTSTGGPLHSVRPDRPIGIHAGDRDEITWADRCSSIRVHTGLLRQMWPVPCHSFRDRTGWDSQYSKWGGSLCISCISSSIRASRPLVHRTISSLGPSIHPPAFLSQLSVSLSLNHPSISLVYLSASLSRLSLSMPKPFLPVFLPHPRPVERPEDPVISRAIHLPSPKDLADPVASPFSPVDASTQTCAADRTHTRTQVYRARHDFHISQPARTHVTKARKSRTQHKPRNFQIYADFSRPSPCTYTDTRTEGTQAHTYNGASTPLVAIQTNAVRTHDRTYLRGVM